MKYIIDLLSIINLCMETLCGSVLNNISFLIQICSYIKKIWKPNVDLFLSIDLCFLMCKELNADLFLLINLCFLIWKGSNVDVPTNKSRICNVKRIECSSVLTMKRIECWSVHTNTSMFSNVKRIGCSSVLTNKSRIYNMKMIECSYK